MASYKNFKFSNVFSYSLFAVFALLSYWVYVKFFKLTPDEEAAKKIAEQEAAVTTTTTANSANEIIKQKAELAVKGLVVSTMHNSLANTLHKELDSVVTNYNKIVSIIKSMSVQTLQLTSIAYGQRELPNYRNSHLLDSDSWLNLFESKKLYGSLKYHLTVVLSDKDQATISSWLSKIA